MSKAALVSVALALTSYVACARTSASYAEDSKSPHDPTAVAPKTPVVTRMTNAALSNRFRIAPDYRRAAAARVRIIGAFAVAEPPHARFVAAWSPGFLPVTLSFSDGRCYSFAATYDDGTLSEGRLNRVRCEGKSQASQPLPQPPTERALRYVGSAWSHAAWANDQAGTTLVTAPNAYLFEPLFTAAMTTHSIVAMASPDSPSSTITLVGRIKGRLTVVALEINY